MPTTERADLVELVHFAIIGLDARIARLQEKRAQWAALTDRRSTVAVAEATTPRKRCKVSTATEAKISTAQKAHWTKEREEKAEEQQLNVAVETAQAKAETIEPAPVRAKARATLIKRGQAKTETLELPPARAIAKTIEPAPVRAKAKTLEPAAMRAKATEFIAERDHPAKNNLAESILAPPDKEIGEPQTPKPDLNTPAGIVEQLALAGARFRITRGGSLIIGNLGSLPPVVQKMFLDHPHPQLLTAAARRYVASGTQSSEK